MMRTNKFGGLKAQKRRSEAPKVVLDNVVGTVAPGGRAPLGDTLLFCVRWGRPAWLVGERLVEALIVGVRYAILASFYGRGETNPIFPQCSTGLSLLTVTNLSSFPLGVFFIVRPVLVVKL